MGKYKSAVLGVQRYSPGDVITEFSLSVAVNGAGIKYSVVSFKAAGVLNMKDKETVKELASGETYDKAVVAEDYNTAPTEAESKTEAAV